MRPEDLAHHSRDAYSRTIVPRCVPRSPRAQARRTASIDDAHAGWRCAHWRRRTHLETEEKAFLHRTSDTASRGRRRQPRGRRNPAAKIAFELPQSVRVGTSHRRTLPVERKYCASAMTNSCAGTSLTVRGAFLVAMFLHSLNARLEKAE